MAPGTPLHGKERNATKATLQDHTTESASPLAEDDLLFYFYCSQFRSPKKMLDLPVEEELDKYVEVSRENSNRLPQTPSTKEELEHNIFMYNLFRRKGCQERANTYIRKIESTKREKMRSRNSKIRELDLEFISLPEALPNERIQPEAAQRRKLLETNARAESAADLLNGKIIMNNITCHVNP